MGIPLAKPVFDEEMKRAAVDALENERFVGGESVHKFEEEFAKYCGTDYAISTSSGTHALQFALMAIGVRSGDEALTTPLSFIATANAVLHAGGTPRFADIDDKTFTIAPLLMAREIGPKTKAVIPVHIYGYPADMDPILDIAHNHNLKVIEDACQAHGATYKGKKAGSLGDVGCFSFYPSNNMTVCGDGGMAVTNDEKVAKIIVKLRDCGRISQYEYDVVGYTARLNTVSAAIGRVQLRRLDKWNERRSQHAELYDRLLSDVKGLKLPPGEGPDAKPAYHLYVIRVKRRDTLKAWLDQNGVQCDVHYQLPIHLQPIYRGVYGYARGNYPVSELTCMEVLSLPMYPGLTESDILFVSERIHEHVKG
jgi:perosamine synthetase